MGASVEKLGYPMGSRSGQRENQWPPIDGSGCRSLRANGWSHGGLYWETRPATTSLRSAARSASSGRTTRSVEVSHSQREDNAGSCQAIIKARPLVHLSSPAWDLCQMPAFVNGGEIMYRQGGSRAEMWRLKSVPPVAFNQERPNLTEGGLDVQGGYSPPCSQGLFRRRDERPRGGPSVRATPGHGAQDARVLRAPRVSTVTTGSQTEARSL